MVSQAYSSYGILSLQIRIVLDRETLIAVSAVVLWYFEYFLYHLKPFLRVQESFSGDPIPVEQCRSKCYHQHHYDSPKYLFHSYSVHSLEKGMLVLGFCDSLVMVLHYDLNWCWN